ncbi:hypothetical protein IAU59_007169 [Kwoniella sp. CBS 9459]
MSRPKVNLRSTAVKRIMQEAAELSSADIEEDGFVAAPLEDDIFEWHCTMRGVANSEYDGGLYHLRILLPPSYPMSAPDIMLMTPNGRFELGKKICIDGLTSFHAGSWQPAWGVRTAVVGLRSFWMQGGEALSAIGALDYSKDERRRLAKISTGWKCPSCGVRNEEIIPAAPDVRAGPSTNGDGVCGGGGGGGVQASSSGGEWEHAREARDDKGKDNATDALTNNRETLPSTSAGEQNDGDNNAQTKTKEGPSHNQQSDLISIEPDPAELPTLVPPPLPASSSHLPAPSAVSQIMPVDIVPPALAVESPQRKRQDGPSGSTAVLDDEEASRPPGAPAANSAESTESQLTAQSPDLPGSSTLPLSDPASASASTSIPEVHSTTRERPTPTPTTTTLVQRQRQADIPPPVPNHAPTPPVRLTNPPQIQTQTQVRPPRSRSLKTLDGLIIFMLGVLLNLVLHKLIK